MIADKLFVISSLLLALSLVNIKSKAAPHGRDEVDEESAGDEGKATIRYEYTDLKEGDQAFLISAEVPVTIKRDEVFPDKWQVRGSQQTTCSTRGQALNPDGSPRSIHRDFEVRLYFDGELVTLYDEGEPSSQIKVKNFFVSDIVENQRYGNPPLDYKELFQPASAYEVYGALPEKEWTFDKYNRVVHVPRPEDQNLKAMVSEIQWPREMRENCKW